MIWGNYCHKMVFKPKSIWNSGQQFHGALTINNIYFVSKHDKFVSWQLNNCNHTTNKSALMFVQCMGVFRFLMDLTILPSGRSVGCASAWYADGHVFDSQIRQHSPVETGHETAFTVIISLPLIPEGELSVTCERVFVCLFGFEFYAVATVFQSYNGG